MATIWRVRAFRLWLVLYVPVVLFFGYHVVSASIAIAEGKHELATWVALQQEKTSKGGREPLTEIDVQFKTLVWDFESLNERKYISIAALLAGLAIPGLVIAISKLVKWIWAQAAPKSSETAQSSSPEDVIIVRYLRAYGWSWAAAGIFLTGLLLSPEGTIKTIVATLVQGIILVAFAWLFMRRKK